MRTSPAFVAGFLLAVLTSSCSGGNAASNLAKPPEFEPEGQTKCGVTKSQARPLIVEWPSADRGDLEARVKRGLVAVHYQGCEMEVLPRCRAPGAYGYTAFTRKDDRIVMRDADELYANVPLGAARLEGKLQKVGELDVAMTVVGKYEADKATVRKDELEGDCAEATHIVSAITAGAFEFFAGAEAEAGGGATVLGAGAGAKSGSQRELLNRDGDKAACDKATPADKEPPPQCGAFLRLEVVPLGEPKRIDPVCPDATAWDGKQCVRKQVVTQIECPAGSKIEAGRCVAAVSTTCPTGLRFEPGTGCVPVIAAQPPAPATVASQPAGPLAADLAWVRTASGVNMSQTEVTVAQFRKCVDAGVCTAGYRTGAQDGQCNYGVDARRAHPMNCINFAAAARFCQWVGGRLPTGAEWKAEAGRRGAFPWGSEQATCARTVMYEPARGEWSRVGGCGAGGTAPVCSKPSGNTASGLCDMAGNVWEWTTDSGSNGVMLMGGSWAGSHPEMVPSANNWFDKPASSMDAWDGVRCAKP